MAADKIADEALRLHAAVGDVKYTGIANLAAMADVQFAALHERIDTVRDCARDRDAEAEARLRTRIDELERQYENLVWLVSGRWQEESDRVDADREQSAREGRADIRIIEPPAE